MRRNLKVSVVLAVVLTFSFALPGGMAFAAPADWPVITSAIPLDPLMEAQIAAMVNGMTLEEKIGQMTQPEIQHVTPEEVQQYHIGSVLNGGGSYPNGDKYASISDWVALADAYWEASMDTSDGYAAIPIIWGTDAVHGHSNVIGATLFPHNIGLGAANDPDLIEQLGTITAREVAVTGIDWTFAPTLAVVRDDRWGRTYEGYSEDPDIVQSYAGRMVTGLQGAFTDQDVVSTAKHYLGDGGTDKGKDQGDTIVSEDDLRTIHGAGYFSALTAGAQTVMTSFSSWNGEKMHGHEYLVNQVLKEQMGFDGFVVSDWNGIGQVPGCTNSSCAEAINAGIDMVMVPYEADWKAFITNTIQQVNDGEISEDRINDAVTRILRVKMRAGLFNGVKPSDRSLANDASVFGSAAHRAVAREAVRKSLVLLKNSGDILPLNTTASVVVAGKSANSIMNQTGGWTISWQGTGNSNSDFPGATSIWQGIEAVASNATLSEDGSAADPVQHDVAIVVIGETPYAEGVGDLGKSKTLEHARLHPEDLTIIQSIADKGIPVVTIFVAGRPLYVNKELNRSDAFVAAWLPGSEGAGVADVIFGDYDFTGKLSYSWPASPCQTPINIGDTDYTPLFPYGYGLTYADTDTLGDALPEEERSYGCDQTDPGSAGTTDTVLDIFMNGANINNGADLGNYVMRIGGPSNWGGVDVSIDPQATTTLPGNEVDVTTEDGVLQFSAKRVVWNDQGQVYSQVEGVSPGVDLTPYINSETSLKFNVKVNAAPTGNVTLTTHCVYPCLGEMPFAGALTAMADAQWHEVSVPLQCLTDDGLDISNVNTPFLIWADGPMDLSLEQIRWEPWTAGPNPDCSLFGPSVDVIDEPVHYLFKNGLVEGYEFGNWMNDSSAIVENPDGSGDQVWSATLMPGTNVEIRKIGLAADMSAYDTPTAQLAFDIRFASIDAGADVLVKVGGWPNLSDLFLFDEVLEGLPALDTWIPVNIPVHELLASDNSLKPGHWVDISETSDPFILESVNGNVAVYVRNVRWEDPELIKNGTFDNGQDNWGFWAADWDATSADMDVAEGILNVHVHQLEPNSFSWPVQVMQGDIELFEGQIYRVAFDAYASHMRNIEVTLESDSYYRYFAEDVTLGTEMQHFEYVFTMESTDVVTWKFLLGDFHGASAIGAHEVFFDNISLRAVPEATTFLLVGTGLLGLGALGRKKRSKK